MRFADLISQHNNIHQINGDSVNVLKSENIEMILNIVQTINNTQVLEDILSLVIFNAIKIANADRGFLLLLDDPNSLRYKVGMNYKGEYLPESDFEISTSVVKDALEIGESICIEHAKSDRNFQSRESIQNLELQTIICTPMIINSEKIGVIYVDSKKINNLKKSEIIRLFEILAGHAAIAIRNAKLFQSLNKAFNDLQDLSERLIKSERIVLKKEINSQIGHDVQNLVHFALLENDSVLKRLQRINIGEPLSKEFLEQLIQKLTFATENIRKIQRYSQALISTNNYEIDKKPGDLNRTLRNVIGYLKKLNKFKLATFELNLDKLPIVEYDHEQIEQVIVNIVTNSVENKKDANIRISTFFDQEFNQIVVKINDNGSGIPREILNQLFSQRISQIEGKGYGLLIAKKIIDNHNGRIYCISEPDKGATFYFSIPIND